MSKENAADGTEILRAQCQEESISAVALVQRHVNLYIFGPRRAAQPQHLFLVFAFHHGDRASLKLPPHYGRCHWSDASDMDRRFNTSAHTLLSL